MLFCNFFTIFNLFHWNRDETTDKNQTKVTSYVSYLRLNPNHKDIMSKMMLHKLYKDMFNKILTA